MPGSDQNNNKYNNVRSNGAFDAFASQAANSADLLKYVKEIAAQTEAIAKNTELYRTYTSSAANGHNRERFFRDRYEEQFNSYRDSINRRAYSSRDRYDRSGYRSGRQDDYYGYRPSSDFSRRSARTFEEGILQGLSRGLLGFDWKKALNKGLSNFAKNLGINLNELPGLIGNKLATDAVNMFKSTSMGQSFMKRIDALKHKLASSDFMKMFMDKQSSSAGFNIFRDAAQAQKSAARRRTAYRSSPTGDSYDYSSEYYRYRYSTKDDYRDIRKPVMNTQPMSPAEYRRNEVRSIREALTNGRKIDLRALFRYSNGRGYDITRSWMAVGPRGTGGIFPMLPPATSISQVGSGSLSSNQTALILSSKGAGKANILPYMLYGSMYKDKFIQAIRKAGYGGQLDKMAGMFDNAKHTILSKFGGSTATGSGLKISWANLVKGAGGGGGVGGASGAAAGQAGQTALVKAGSTAMMKGGVAAAAKGALASNPYGWLVIAILIKLKQVIDAFQPAVEGVSELIKIIKASTSRESDSRKKYIELESKRLTEDLKTMVEVPFKILQESAEKVEAAWDNTLSVISSTQGYTKAQVQSLMAYVANRLKTDNLSAVVNAADIMQKLSDVLKEGLSGKVAEEFAYQASILNAAIPTQDFFQYASSYASIVANLVKEGKTQEEALSLANQQLISFANDVLYVNRQITGGTSTGLKNASSLFEQAVKVSIAGQTLDTRNISTVLTSVAGIVGAIAPDLATSITDAVYNAAVGGNETTLVALRSLAGVNASNTEFLRLLVNQPQQLFEKLFRNLAAMQNMSNDAYMEVADQVSKVFGLTRDAFSRVDFNYIADALHSSLVDIQSNIDNKSIKENLKLLQDGQTTLTKDQLRNQQINQYMIEEGLALVLDSEIGRAVQQHMWDEQLAREMINAEYGVNIVGPGLQMLEKIVLGISNVLEVLSPFSAFRKSAQLISSLFEGAGQKEDLARALGATEVGSGHSGYPYLLRGKDLKLTPSYVELLAQLPSYNTAYKKISKYKTYRNLYDVLSNWMSPNLYRQIDMVDNWIYNYGKSSYEPTLSPVTSQYTFSSVSKSGALRQSQYLQQQAALRDIAGSSIVSNVVSTLSSVTSAAAQKLQQMIEELAQGEFDTSTKSYEDWRNTAVSRGIADWDKALAEAGYDEHSLENLYQQKQGEKAQEAAATRQINEDEFWAKGTTFWTDRLEFPQQIYDKFSTHMNNLDSWGKRWIALWNIRWEFPDQIYDLFLPKLNDIISNIKDVPKWQKAWTDYYVDRTVYKKSFGDTDYAAIMSQEQSSTATAIDRLAKVLVENVSDLSDPTVQTNTILAQILLLLTQLVQQGVTRPASTPSLGTTLIELALGRST